MRAGAENPRLELASIVKSLNALLQGKQGSGPDAASDLVQSSSQRDLEGLELLRGQVEGCRRCSLHKTRTNTVFGSGTGKTRILFVGEAPGRDEDLQGLPFVGRAGQLLTKIIEAIKFEREDVYIANVLKCRPPNNRNPLPEEVARCRPYLKKQIDLLKPKVICTLGVFATQMLLDTKSPLTVLRGQVHEIDGLTVVPTYHPAACLRYPRLKEAVWEDVKLLRREYLS
jgi:DNA polymerase